MFDVDRPAVVVGVGSNVSDRGDIVGNSNSKAIDVGDLGAGGVGFTGVDVLILAGFGRRSPKLPGALRDEGDFDPLDPSSAEDVVRQDAGEGNEGEGNPPLALRMPGVSPKLRGLPSF